MLKFKIIIFINLVLFHILSFAASINVGSGSHVDFGSTTISSNGLSLHNHGQIEFGNSSLQFSNLSNQSSAVINAANSVLYITENWLNNGIFNAMTSSVQFVDGVTGSSSISGQTTFSELNVTSTLGKNLIFESGRQQTIPQNLILNGINGNILIIFSDSAGDEALLNLEGNATQNINFVDVTDNYGVWQILAPGSPNNYNSIEGNNVRGWFGTTLQIPVPTIGLWAQLLLISSMLLIYLIFNNISTKKG